MFLKSHLFTVINLCTTQFQVDGLENRSQADNLKDQILDLMMKPFLARGDHSLLMEKNGFQRRLTRVHTSLSHLDGLDNKKQANNSRNLTLVLMTKLFSVKRDL